MKTILARLILLTLLTAVLIGPSAHAATDPAKIPFLGRTVQTSAGPVGYQVFVPAHWNKRKKSPVILFLHGAGERGDDNQAQTKNGIRLLIGQDPDRFPCIVVCPQCRTNGWWAQPDMEQMALKALDQSLQEFNGDPKQVYLTGLSMGGYGTWDIAKQSPGRWAAIAVCCGGLVIPGQPAPPSDIYFTTAQKLASIPTWVFDGEADPVVPVSESRQMVALLYSLKADPKKDSLKYSDLKYTEYPGVGHNSWDYAYKEPGLLPWLLSHKLKQEPTPAQAPSPPETGGARG